MPELLAISDLHVSYAENRSYLEQIRSGNDDDWLIVAGDVADLFDDVVQTLASLRARFDRVIWVPGNHELWTPPGDPQQARGVARYERLVGELRRIDVLTPEDPYPVWKAPGRDLVIAPLFLLYDYTFRRPGIESKAAAMRAAEAAGVLATDELLLHSDPYPTRQAWCADRLGITQARLEEIPPDLGTVLINHFPLVREPTEVLYYPDFALWCGTTLTRDWPTRYRAEAVAYGHLHIPRTLQVDGITHHEVSLGYPREWGRRRGSPRGLVPILDTGGVAS